MKRKIFALFVLLAACLCATALFAVAGCEDETADAHEHTYMRVWSSNASGHFHKASCEHKDLTTPVEAHVDADMDDVCDVCGYEMEHVHRFSEVYSADEEYHWRDSVCGDTTDLQEYARHTWTTEVTKQPGCEEEGLLTKTCTVCQKKVTESLAPTGHELGEWVDEKPATCAAEGYVAHYPCLRCDKKFDIEQEEILPENFVLEIDEEAHNWGEPVVLRKSDCKTEGEQKYTCLNDSSHTKLEPIPVNAAHVWQEDGTCAVCGRFKTYYWNEDHTKIYMGRYPQTRVTDPGVLAGLNMRINTTPTPYYPFDWTSYKYYNGNTNDNTKDFMWYKDVSYLGDTYRAVYFTSYRQITWQKDRFYQIDNGYEINTKYFFKFEPVLWRLLEREDGAPVSNDNSILLMSDVILDAQQYYHCETAPSYANLYDRSDIRKWLVKTFFETLFDENEKELIKTVEVDNTPDSTETYDNRYAQSCSNTYDQIFLMSYTEGTDIYDIGNTDIVWNETMGDATKRTFKGSDYAKCQGLQVEVEDKMYGPWNKPGCSGWWLRSPSPNRSYTANYSDPRGTCTYSSVYEVWGVLPLMWITP